ncbi:unknown protein [Microcystis aeruginosa NIES-843]|uniref:Transposase n=1 Tax=Microcystis aeruginosa (strain NIES-843 / IAM M-2473) TaxID=449447 RepID=B0JY17_MICAN|nr:unknown protein [Microcystis aeruginosa NIES-843]
MRGSITQFSGKKYLNFPPDHSHIWYFLETKKSKSLIHKVFRFIQQTLIKEELSVVSRSKNSPIKTDS